MKRIKDIRSFCQFRSHHYPLSPPGEHRASTSTLQRTSLGLNAEEFSYVKYLTSHCVAMVKLMATEQTFVESCFYRY